MTALASEDPFVGRLVEVFIEDVLAARFGHGGSVVSPLSRHAILHGGDTAYGTEVNSRTAVLLVDYFAFVSRIQRGVAGEDEHVAAVGTQSELSSDALSIEEAPAPAVTTPSTRVDGVPHTVRASAGKRRTRRSK